MQHVVQLVRHGHVGDASSSSGRFHLMSRLFVSTFYDTTAACPPEVTAGGVCQRRKNDNVYLSPDKIHVC